MKNCLTYALCMWMRFGGYLLVRKSRFIEEFNNPSCWHPAHLVPHFLHRSTDHVVTQYLPTAEDKAASQHQGAFVKWLKLWHFNGEIVGDDKKGGE